MNELSKRELFALELACNALRNTNAFTLSSEQIALNAVNDADALIDALERTAPKPEASDMQYGPSTVGKLFRGAGPDADGWIPHRPCDPIPEGFGWVRFRNGREAQWLFRKWFGEFWSHAYPDSNLHIIAWKPA